MDINELVAALDTEISRLTQIRDLLGDVNNGSSAGPTQRAPAHSGNSNEPRRPGRPKGSKNKATGSNPEEFATKRRTMSAADKERIAAAQRARWAKLKGTDAAKKTRSTAAKAAATKSSGPKGATKKTPSLPSKKPATKPLTKSAASPIPAPAKKAVVKTKPAKEVVARRAAKTSAKKPGVLKKVNAKSQAGPSSASTNATAEEATTPAAE